MVKVLCTDHTLGSLGDGRLGCLDCGRTHCPHCDRYYWPKLGARNVHKQHMTIQMEFPNAKPFEREQLQTGICSSECWDKYLGG